MANLSDLLRVKMDKEHLSQSQAALLADVSLPSYSSALKGQSKPNATTLGKYAKFLGVNLADLVNAAAKEQPKRRGRPPGSVKKRGRPPGSGRTAAPGPKRRNASGALSSIETALGLCRTLLDDPLALRVNRMNARQRGVIEAVAKTL